MPITSAVGLVEAVRRFNLLSPAQTEELAGLHPRFADARGLARELIQRGWLTPYQINHLVAGNGGNLILGQYVLIERIGEGGMGQVIKARHQRLERIVALKLIRKERLTSADAVQRFQREARAAARLSHPNLVTVYDADEVGGTAFYVMEYVEGTDLARLLKTQGPQPIREACDAIRQAALGLQHAHEQGLVHRDIKPANLMLTTRRVVKVLDMGLARLALTEADSDATDPMTREGTVMGTPDYMAPEQAVDSHSADIRADLYSLGCTLFHLLTGKVPFRGGTLTDKLLKHQMEPAPRVESLRPEVPPPLAVIVRKLLAKKPAERYQTPAELAAVLEPLCGRRPPVAIPVGETVDLTPEEQSRENTRTEALTVGGAKPVAIPVPTVAVPATKPRWKDWLKTGRRLSSAAWFHLVRISRQRPRLMAGAGVVVALLLIGMVVWLGSHRKGDGGPDSPPDSGKSGEGKPTTFDPQWVAGMKRDPIPFEQYLEPLPAEVTSWLGDLWGRHWGAIRCAAISPDGSLAASGGNDNLIRLWDAKTLEPRGILPGHTFPVIALAFSPDGKTLASCSEGQDWRVWLWDLEKKTSTKLEGHENVVTQLAFSTDSKRLLSAGQEQVIRQWDVATGRSRRLPLAPGVRCVALSPNGRHVLSGHADKTLRLWDLDTGGEVKRFEGHTDVTNCLAFAPDGSRAVSVSIADTSMRLWDVEKGMEVCQWKGGDFSPSRIAFSPDGRRVVYNHGNSQVRVCDAQTLAMMRVVNAGVLDDLAYSPDSHRALVCGGGQNILRLWDLETGVEVLRPTGHANAVSGVAFTPDGHYLLSGSHDGAVSLWNLESKRTVGGYSHGSAVYCIAVSPDGRYAVSGGTSTGPDIKTLWFWEIEPRRLAVGFNPYPSNPTSSVAISPDGHISLCGGNTAPALHLWDIEKLVEGRTIEGVTEAISCVAFSPDSKQAVSGGSLKTLRLWDVTTGKEIRSLAGHTDPITSVAFVPDGRHILSGSADATVRLWDLEESQPKGRILDGAPKAAITCVTIAPDGKTFAASGQDGRITVWKASGERLWQTQLPGAVLGLAYAGDSRHLATANANGTIFILRLPDPESSPGK